MVKNSKHFVYSVDTSINDFERVGSYQLDYIQTLNLR